MSLLRFLTAAGDVAWHHASTVAAHTLRLRRIPFRSSKEYVDKTLEQIDDDHPDWTQYLFCEVRELINLPVESFSVEDPPAWLPVSEQMERWFHLHDSLKPQPEKTGFHRLKDKDQWTTRTYLRDYCVRLSPRVEATAEFTRRKVAQFRRSARGQGYLVHPPGDISLEGLTDLEAWYQRAMYMRWYNQSGAPNSGWHWIIDYEVPMYDRDNSPINVGTIDNLGISQGGFPIVVEVKVLRPSRGADTPLQAILEAAAYACVVQADWAALRAELIDRVGTQKIQINPPEELTECPLVVAAPPEYWTFWQNPNRRSFVDAKPALRLLVQRFQDNHFPITFVSVNGRVEGRVNDYERMQARRICFLED
jgi:hypothetical protein